MAYDEGEWLVRQLASILFLMFFASIGFAFAKSDADNRDFIVDQALGGLERGSAILAPGQYGEGVMNPKAPGSSLSPSMDTGAVSRGSGGGVSGGHFGGFGSSGSSGGGIDQGVAGGGGTGINVDADLGSGSGGGGNATTNIDTDLGGGGASAGGSTDTDTLLSADTSADLGGETVEIGADVGGSSLVGVEGTGGEIVDIGAEAGTTEGSLLDPLVEAVDIGAEIDASGGTTGTEAELGVEADVDGSVAGDDVASDPADGLSTDTTTVSTI